MNYKIIENSIPPLQELVNLYKDAGWSNYTKDTALLVNAYKNSLFVLAVWDSSKLIGIIRVVGDGYSILYIQDLLILKEYQHMGIGSRLLEEVMDKYKNVYQTVLLSDNEPKTKAFNQKMGLVSGDTYGCISFIKFNM
ncbi:Acetyltransferase (GNAT) domain-containing protein [Anaerocolumna jejuensis DSM 15929]|uniref:Acetyltransferase (GNAT) domain-containing protein n=1 Tax=Anaerocolumna jejuensis DSM 15929 TaxID=1121322 RepID=A0A1M6WR64_9FIRM|nr:GNAT family N-acetyltransferase [Anaerocolumna jejuensis]SHK96079.1 Acetyltransferase (GNAT) domain-containing protein [Anaerocolumna jejuensis DSM 15929]